MATKYNKHRNFLAMLRKLATKQSVLRGGEQVILGLILEMVM